VWIFYIALEINPFVLKYHGFMTPVAF